MYTTIVEMLVIIVFVHIIGDNILFEGFKKKLSKLEKEIERLKEENKK